MGSFKELTPEQVTDCSPQVLLTGHTVSFWLAQRRRAMGAGGLEPPRPKPEVFKTPVSTIPPCSLCVHRAYDPGIAPLE